MQRTFIKELLELDSLTFVERALHERRQRILTAIADGEVQPSEGLMRELAELNIALGDVPEVSNE